MKTFNQILLKLENSDTDWLTVNEERCIHSYFDDYYILLCNWYDARQKKDLIYIEVDNVKDMIDNVVKKKLFDGTNEYNRLLPLYKKAVQIAKPAIRLSAS